MKSKSADGGGSAYVTTLLLAIVCAALPVRAASQSSALDDALRAYRALEFAEAKVVLTSMISDPQSLTPDELAEAHLILGSILFSENQPEAARRQFAAAIQLSPAIRPNPLDASPKIVEFFETVRNQSAVATTSNDVRYITIYDARPAAAMRSAVLPGWGQYYKGERTKAVWLWSAWAASAGGTVVTHFGRRRAKDRYLDETDRDRVVERYETFNNWHQARSGLALAAGAVWIYSYVDAVLRPTRPTIRTASERASVTLAPARSGVSLSISIPVRSDSWRR